MTTDLITAPDESSLGDIAAILATHRISAVPIVDQFDVAIGVVSWTDIAEASERDEQRSPTIRSWFRRRGRWPSRWRSRPAREAMTAPPVTIGPDASLSAAGRVMHRRDVGRLLVVDHADRLVGVVTRRDLLKVHNRLDAVIRDEVLQRILRRTLMISPDAVQIVVDDGVVTLAGRVDHKSTALAAIGLVEAVAGVTDVVDRLSFATDDTIPEPGARQSGTVGRGFATYAAHVIRQEAVR
jgi:CBS domain-containing protein